MAETPLTHAACVPIAFVGTVLGPFFTQDPGNPSPQAQAPFAAIADLEAKQAAADWPFVKAPVAQEALEEMQKGLSGKYADGRAKAFAALSGAPALAAARDEDMAGWLAAHSITVSGAGDRAGLGAQLEVMAAVAQAGKPDLLQDFLCAHVLAHAPRALEELEASTEHPFYHGLVLLTLETLQGMQRMFGLKPAR